jgi:predicted HAD superfamily hydrolase
MYSFDIFDTLITRRTAVPEGIFMLMQEKLQQQERYDSFLTTNFYELRKGAEKLAQHFADLYGKREITLDDIYRTLAMTACVSEKQEEELKALEIELECCNVLAIKRNIALLKKLKVQGEQVVLISDMYLNEANIRRMLCLVDPVFKNIPIYVSSDYGKTKGSGELFKVVKKKENVNFSDWTHYGDNEYADIKAARQLGIHAVYLPCECLKEYERPEKDLYCQLSIGISRYIRSQGQGNTVGEVGSSLAGPILYPYVSWVLRESIKQGINRLYFVSRDGWILWQIADTIIQIEKYPIKTAYIYGSRTAWRLPCYDGSKEELGRILYYSNLEEVLSLKDLAKLFQMTVEELQTFLPEKLRQAAGEKRIAKSQIETISRWLQEKETFRRYLVNSQEENRKLVIRYLQQEMDVSDDRYAFVELSGTGFTQGCLAEIVGKFYGGEIRNFFYRLDDTQKKARCKFIQFYPSKLKRYMLELLCRAPHGQVEGYREENGRILPVLEEAEGEQMKAYHIEEYRDAVLAYVKQIERTYIQNELTCMPKLNLAKTYTEFMTEHPPKRIAEYFCHMPFSSGGRKNSMVEFAPAVSKRQLRKIYFWNNGENVRQVYHGDCMEYALAISDEATKYKEKCQKYRKKGIGKWIVTCNNYLYARQKPGIDYFCPWELLRGRIVIYGAGKVGQAFVKQAKQRHARCESILWVDSNYVELQEEGMDIKSPEAIKEYSFDRVIIAVRQVRAKQEIWDKLRNIGIESEKLYYG